MEALEKDLSDELIDYDIYIMSLREKIMNILFAGVIIFLVGYLFYRNIYISLILSLFALRYPKIRTAQIIKKRKNNLTIQFKDMLYSLATSLNASKSFENAVKDSYNDLSLIYIDKKAEMLTELEVMIKGMSVSVPATVLFEDFAERSHLEDVQNFSDVLNTVYGRTSDLASIIRSTSATISDKIEIKQEIETLIAGKKFESRVMSAMPIGLVLVLSLSAKDFMEPVFTTVMGKIVMTIAIVIFVAAFFVSEKIMNIEV